MQLDFFPSRTLTTYLAKMFVMRIFAVLVMLVLVLLLSCQPWQHAHPMMPPAVCPYAKA